jgi:hypothetical protein
MNMAIDRIRSLAIFSVLTLVVAVILGCGLFTTATTEIAEATSASSAIETPAPPTVTAAIMEAATHMASATQDAVSSSLPLLTVTATATNDLNPMQEPTNLPSDTAVKPTSTLSLSVSLPLTNTAPITQTIIGYSYQNRPIIAHQFGEGSEAIVLIGGIHGGYEWNTILLAYEAIDYFSENPEVIPTATTLFIIPSANPDGLFSVIGREGRFTPEDLAEDTVPGRFNGRGVDLNRNWECQWAEAAFWRDQPVNPGAGPYSEPESVALRDFLISLQPNAVIFYHSAADGVYSAGCPDIYPPTRQLADIYGSAAGYPIYDRFDHYDITGDAGDWLAIQGIPSIAVELATHEDVEWEKNKLGILEVLTNHNLFLPIADIPNKLPQQD